MMLFATMGASASNSVSSFNCVWNFCRAGAHSNEISIGKTENEFMATDLEKDLRLRESHITRSWGRAAPPALAAEIACPELCLDIGIMGCDDKDERRRPKRKLRWTNSIRGCRDRVHTTRSTHYDMLPYLRMFDGVRKTRHGAGTGNLHPKGWDGSRL